MTILRDMKQDRLALDRGPSARTTTEDGHLHVAGCNISKANVCDYWGHEIPDAEMHGLDPDKSYKLFRDPQELEAATASFNGKPILFDHKPITADDHDFDGTVGSISNARYEHPYMKADLSIWASHAIRAIEANEKKELSAAYRYDFVPERGSFDGQEYHGRMTNVRANHVALVTSGRAGKDVVVQDEKQKPLKDIPSMPKIALSRTATALQGALAVHLKPKLAQDKKIDFRPMLKDVTAKNFKASKNRLAADIKRQARPMMARDANIDDVMTLLDALEEVIPEMEVEPLSSVSNASNDPDSPDAMDDADDSGLRDILKELGILDEDIEIVCSRMAGPKAAADDAPPDMGSSTPYGGAGREDSGGGSMRTYAPVDPAIYGQTDHGADSMAGSGTFEDDGTSSIGGGPVKTSPPDDSKDDIGGSLGGSTGGAIVSSGPSDGSTRMMGKDKGMVTKPAMDAAIASAVKAVRQNERAIRVAMDSVRPHVGNLSIIAESEADVYKAALECKGISHKGVPASAYKPLFDNVMSDRAGMAKKPALPAMDAAAAKSFDERFGTSRIGHVA